MSVPVMWNRSFQYTQEILSPVDKGKDLILQKESQSLVAVPKKYFNSSICDILSSVLSFVGEWSDINDESLDKDGWDE